VLIVFFLLVISFMPRPLLLADYLTQSYRMGGSVAVLALESLFMLIVQYNLDYPDFFLSLYKLCTVEVFSAKYRQKFILLLFKSLHSANLPAYLVAAFAKRLAFLALHTPSHNSHYCVAQIIWLLRKHPQCQGLIHRLKGDGKTFDNSEESELDKSNALSSTLWEFLLLENHYLYNLATLATSLRNIKSTDNGKDGHHLSVEDFIGVSYSDLSELHDGGKKERINAALAYKKPLSLFLKDSILDTCFA
jgi:U3 small nucleolar RNA-associated protein 19